MSTRNSGENEHWRDWLPPLPPSVSGSDDQAEERSARAEIGSAATGIGRIGRGGRAPSLSAAVRRHAALAGASLALAAAVGGCAWWWPGWSHPAVTGPAASPRSTTVSPVQRDVTLGGGLGCDPVRSPNLVRGNGTGSLADGPDAILAFEHAYYTARSGTAARAVTTTDADVPSADTIDAGISTITPGTTACVVIMPQTPGRYLVTISENAAGGAVHSFTQLITTTAQDGSGVRITGIHAADS
ncbi:hypothetical protein [Nocardia alni]|uniref:hypothetical protein n=1 Tax=Nocardia alni TaxID=2815723 RepID=UPI001C20F7BC|nr:hypothetical protein [Nocardia alni]